MRLNYSKVVFLKDTKPRSQVGKKVIDTDSIKMKNPKIP